MMNLQAMSLMKPQAMTRPVRFGQEAYQGHPVGDVYSSYYSERPAVNMQDDDGKIYPLMVGLRPAQEKALNQIVDYTRLATVQQRTMIESIDRLTSTLQNRFIT